MKNIYKYILYFLLATTFSISSKGQIFVEDGVYSQVTEYSELDSAYVFCSDIDDGKLIAVDSSGNGGYNFSWYKYDEVTKAFTISLSGFSINSDSTRSEITGLASGGYKIVLQKPDTTQEYIGWVHNQNPENVSVSIDIKDPLDCKLIRFTAAAESSVDYTYYDPTYADTSFSLENKISLYSWDSDNSSVSIPNYNYHTTSTNELPLDDTKYTVTVSDKFGCTATADYDYTAIITKAEVSAEFWEYDYKEDEGGLFSSYTEGNPESSPLKVVFSNESQKGEKYRWFFGDTLWVEDVDTVFTDDETLTPEHTYYYVQEYTAELLSISPYGCRDSIQYKVNVAASEIGDIPNVFTPNNGDEDNNVYRFDLDQVYSLRHVNINIFAKNGRKVHEYQGAFYDWKGWDGTDKSGKQDAAQGVYYIVFEIVGWDGKEFNQNYPSGVKLLDGTPGVKESKTGVIYLYR